MDKTLKLLANVPIDDALSAIHDVLRGLKYHFDKSDFERLIGSKYSEAATPSANSQSGYARPSNAKQATILMTSLTMKKNASPPG